VWREDSAKDEDATEGRFKAWEAATRRVENPRFARTIDDDDTVEASRRTTRLHTPYHNPLKVRYRSKRRLGHGAFGEVHKALNVDTGKYIAVKILKPKIEHPTAVQFQQWRDRINSMLKREVEILAKIDHVSCVKRTYSLVNPLSPLIASYRRLHRLPRLGWAAVEIFMGLKDGNLDSLVQSGTPLNYKQLFHQMLQAVDCLHHNGITHRDIKPENILFTRRKSDGIFHYQLGDFGYDKDCVKQPTFSEPY
jgi:serine/threonine protein kinase